MKAPAQFVLTVVLVVGGIAVYELARRPAEDDRAKQDLRDAGLALYGDYERALRAVVPGAEADLILQGIQRASGSRRDGR